MQRLHKVLNHCCSASISSSAAQDCTSNVAEREYMHFWSRSQLKDTDSLQQTETQHLHDSIQKNNYFLNEVECDKGRLLNDIQRYSDAKCTCYGTEDIMRLFVGWLRCAFKYSPSFIRHANAVCVSTVDADGCPSSRFVLLKSIELKQGHFIFFSNYESDKALQIASVSDQASMVFYWDILDISVRVKGHVERVDEQLSDQYWSTRPKPSKLSAITSNQSRPIASKQELEVKYKAFEAEYKNTESGNVPRPAKWGGFALNARSVEFWNGNKYRCHDRTRFSRQSASNTWRVVRLQP